MAKLRSRTRIVTTLLALLAAGPAAPAAERSGAYLAELAWPEAGRRLAEAPVVILPFGPAAKEHGPHLPLNADARVMEYLCEQAVVALPVLAAPPILHGWLPPFRQYPGTEVSDPTVFIRYVDEVARSLVRHGAKRVVFLNTSISKAGGLPLSIVARDVRERTGTPTLVVSWDDLETPEIDALREEKRGTHAGEIETSIHLFLQPGLVRMDRAVPDYGREAVKGYPGYQPGLFSRDPKDPAFSETGVFGDPTRATAEKGRRALAILTAQWLKALRGFADTPLPAGR
ncbi:MAG TPA: creatininase family protein [Vicinamibacteria bacterium]